MAAQLGWQTGAGPLLAGSAWGGRMSCTCVQMPLRLIDAVRVPAALHWCALGQPQADNEKRQRSTHVDVARLLIGAPDRACMLLPPACDPVPVFRGASACPCLTRGRAGPMLRAAEAFRLNKDEEELKIMDIPDVAGDTPLHVAVSWGQVQSSCGSVCVARGCA